MKILLLIFLLALPMAGRWAVAQEAPPPAEGARDLQRMPPAGAGAWEYRQHRRGANAPQPERREAWMQMSPEERQRLRSDIRDAGRMVYPRRGQHQKD